MFDAFDAGADPNFALDWAEADAGCDAREPGGLICAACRYAVTRHEFATAIAGKTVHTCTNPHGYTYTFRTFTSAPGCCASGAPMDEYSWFPPHAWQLAHCRACRAHLGWRFAEPAGHQFFALIESRLSEEHDS